MLGRFLTLGPRRSISGTIIGAFAAMGLLTAALGGYGLYVLIAAGDFVVDLYDRPLMATNFARAASVDFAQMDKELARRDRAAPAARAAIDAKIAHFYATFIDDLAVAKARSLSQEEVVTIDDIAARAAHWNELRLASAPVTANAELDRLADEIVRRFDLLSEATTGHSFVERRKVVSAIGFFKYSSATALIGALLLSGGLTVLLIRRIILPLRAAAAVADRIADGELQAPIPQGGSDETGLLLRSMTVMQDNIRLMVEREKAQRLSAQRRLVDALESSPEAIVLVDGTGKIVIGNSQLARFFPAIAAKLDAGMSFADAFRQLGEIVIDGAPAGSELLSAGSEFRAADGRWLRVSRSATADGGFFLLISDISDIKEREQRLDEARRHAEAASEAKSAFLAAISHELRTPLNAVIGFSEILSAEIFGPLGNPKYVDYAQGIQTSGKHLLGLINSVLDLSKHQAGKLELVCDSFDLVAVIEICATIMRDQGSRAEVTLEKRLPKQLTMWGDAGRLQQMLLNLLSNAVKFTEAGGKVTVSADILGGSVRIQVADTGIGMSADEIPIALAAFGQVDSRLARRYEGTGLGLPLARSIAELHGGKLALDSERGRGTTVTVLLPRGTAPAQAGEPAPPLADVA
jgi:signal transduction histidine kinase